MSLKVLALVTKERLPNNDVMYEALADYVDLEIIKVSRKDQKDNLSKVLKKISFEKYERVLFDLLFKRIYKCKNLIRKINNLVVLDEDTNLNYNPASKNYKKFSKFYTKVNQATVLSSGFGTTRKLIGEGVNAVYFPKGYDEKIISFENKSRDIELGFIGRTKSKVYSERLNMLESFQERAGLQFLRTEPGDAYRNMMNRIRFFISADVGLNEYMIKNFEAMACGCIVFSYKQGEEEAGLNLRDMENIVLYSTIDEALEKLEYLRNHPDKASDIQKNSLEFVKNNHSYSVLARKLYEILQVPPKEVQSNDGWLDKFVNLVTFKKS